jgi:hypothetical protein
MPKPSRCIGDGHTGAPRREPFQALVQRRLRDLDPLEAPGHRGEHLLDRIDGQVVAIEQQHAAMLAQHIDFDTGRSFWALGLGERGLDLRRGKRRSGGEDFADLVKHRNWIYSRSACSEKPHFSAKHSCC